MTLIGYGVFYNEDGSAILTGGYSGRATSKIYKKLGTAIRVAATHPNCHVKELYVKDFRDAVGAIPLTELNERLGMVFP